jgi:hypothetical protein
MFNHNKYNFFRYNSLGNVMLIGKSQSLDILNCETFEKHDHGLII